MSVIGATENRFTPGRHVIKVRRDAPGGEFFEQPVIILRETTWEAYRDFHIAEGLRYEPHQDGTYYYEMLMD